MCLHLCLLIRLCSQLGYFSSHVNKSPVQIAIREMLTESPLRLYLTPIRMAISRITNKFWHECQERDTVIHGGSVNQRSHFGKQSTLFSKIWKQNYRIHYIVWSFLHKWSLEYCLQFSVYTHTLLHKPRKRDSRINQVSSETLAKKQICHDYKQQASLVCSEAQAVL